MWDTITWITQHRILLVIKGPAVKQDGEKKQMDQFPNLAILGRCGDGMPLSLDLKPTWSHP